jgi:uncharacterized protein
MERLSEKHCPGFLERFSLMIVLAFLATTPLLFYTAFRAIQNKTNRVTDWLPETYQETEELHRFRRYFVSDQFVVISWEGCRLGGDPRNVDSESDDPRIERLARMLVPADANPVDDDNQVVANKTAKADFEGIESENARRYFKSVTTGRRLLNRLTSERIGLGYEAALERIKGSAVGADGHQTCLIVTLTDEALENLRSIISRGTGGWLQIYHPEGVLLTAMRKCGIDPESAHFGGPPVDNIAIDEEGERTLYRLATFASLVGFALAWWSLRSLRLTLIVFACGIISAVASLSVVWLSGASTDSFLMAMPSLVNVLAVSGAIHLISYYRDAIFATGLRDAPSLAIRNGWKATVLCSITTAIGLLALCTSELAPIQKFGVFSAIGVMLMLAALFIFLPTALYLWPGRFQVGARETDLAQSRKSNSHSDEEFWLGKFWLWFGSNMIRHHALVTIACTLIICGAGAGVLNLKTSIDLMKLFETESRIRQDYEWLEAKVGRLVPIEMVLRFDVKALRQNDETEIDRKRYSLLERLTTVSSVAQRINLKFGKSGEDLVSRPLSAATFVPPLPKRASDLSDFARRSAFNKHLQNEVESLIQSGYLAIDPQTGDELWRISVRVAAFKDVDYGEFTKRLQNYVAPLVVHHNTNLSEAIPSTPSTVQSLLSVTYTGVIPIVYKAQRALLNSLIESTFWSFITITPLLMVVSRGLLAGVVVTLPNVLPVLVVFGGMGWLGIPVTIGSMMSASIALGVAVDDTIHYLMWFRKELDHSADRNQACLAAYRRCANPTLQAALISGCGFSVFGLSTFTPTSQFGLLMLTILLCGVIAELILLPALLAGPLGRAFEISKRPKTLPVQQPSGTP